MKNNIVRLSIIRQRKIARKTSEVSFGLGKENFTFTAGQYVHVDLPKLLYPDQKGMSRVFSIVSSPNNKNEIVVAFRDSVSGFKRTLIELPLGTIVDIKGSSGSFTLPKDVSRSIVFITAGIGIAPCLSMIRFAIEEKLPCKLTLLYANRDKESAAYLDELKKIKEDNPNFRMILAFERINEQIVQNALNNNGDDTAIYVVGQPKMVIDARSLLYNMGVDEGRVYFEEFT